MVKNRDVELIKEIEDKRSGYFTYTIIMDGE